MANVLCVVAHPDDEVLGCGGTLAKHAEAGDDVRVYIIAARGLSADALRTANVLGVRTGITSPTYLDQKLDTYPFADVVGIIENQRQVPDVIYTHNPDDLNLDHQIVARAVLTAFRAPHSQADILAFETLSSTEFGPTAFQPNHWEVLTAGQLRKKEDALDCYPTEVRGIPHPRNAPGISIHASFRGQQVCQNYAEAFRVLRSIRA